MKRKKRKTKRLMKIFSRSGVFVPKNIVKEIIERDDVYKYLWQIVKKDKFWGEDGVGDGWPPIHTLFILGLKGGKTSFKILEWMIKKRGEELGVFGIESLPSIFYSFLPRFFREIRKIALDTSLNKFVRVGAIKALCALVVKKSEKEERVLETCHRFLDESDPNENALAFPLMVELENEELLKKMREKLFEGTREFLRSHPNTERITSSKGDENVTISSFFPPVREMKKLWEHFSYDNLNLFFRLAYGSEPQFVDFHGKNISKREVRGLKAINSMVRETPSFSIDNKHVRTINLTRTRIADVTPLTYFPELREIYLYRTNVNDLTPLKHLKKLRRLNLGSTLLSDISPLNHLNNLRHLDLSDVKSRKNQEKGLSDISPLTDLRNLQFLNLCGTSVRDLAPLQDLTKLEDLSLENTRVSSIQPLKNLREMDWLNLDSTSVTDLSPVKNMSQLRELVLFLTPVSDISPLKHLTKLQRLNLWGTNVSDISPLKGLKHLKVLTLGDISTSENKETLKTLKERETEVHL